MACDNYHILNLYYILDIKDEVVGGNVQIENTQPDVDVVRRCLHVYGIHVVDCCSRKAEMERNNVSHKIRYKSFEHGTFSNEVEGNKMHGKNKCVYVLNRIFYFGEKKFLKEFRLTRKIKTHSLSQ